MPLCNVAYSLLRANERLKARVPAALGIIEDITTFANAPSTGNLSKLRATGYPELLTQVIVDYASKPYLSKRRGEKTRTESARPATESGLASHGRYLRALDFPL